MHTFNFRNTLAESKLYIRERFIATKIKTNIFAVGWLLFIIFIGVADNLEKKNNFGAMMRIITVIDTHLYPQWIDL